MPSASARSCGRRPSSAAYAVYRHNRVLDAIVLLGAAMIVNLSATFTDLFGHLAALRHRRAAALAAGRAGRSAGRLAAPAREREPRGARPRSCASGIVFAGGSVVLAWVLTSVAVAAPLTAGLAQLRRRLDRRARPVRGRRSAASRTRSRGSPAAASGPASPSPGEWISNDDAGADRGRAARALPAHGDVRRLHRARLGSQRGPDAARSRPSEPLFTGRLRRAAHGRGGVRDRDDRDPDAPDDRPQPVHGRLTRSRVSPPCVVHESAGQPVLGGIEAANPIGAGEGYQVDGALSNATEAQLAARGHGLSAGGRGLYLDTPGLTDRVAPRRRACRRPEPTTRTTRRRGAGRLPADATDSFDYHTNGRRPGARPGPRRLLPVRSGGERQSATASTTPAPW